MAITDKTRKTLWARSGNRCSMCRTELVAERNEYDRNLNIGDECHIISESQKGPRHQSEYNKDYDDYENLILLCKNDHKRIDEQWETYSVELLKSIKTDHEKWIRSVIDNARSNYKENNPKILPRLTTGKQIVDIIKEVHAYEFDHDEFKSQEETNFVSRFLQNLQDLSDISAFSEFEIGRQVQIGFDLNKDIEELEKYGLFLFGERRSTRMYSDKKDDLGIWDIATITILHKDNPEIIYPENSINL